MKDFLKPLFICLFAINLFGVFSQIGFNPFKQQHENAKALIVGVSDYQNIKNLNYAHKDAVKFAEYLMNNKGWKMNSDNIQLLTNQNAKQGDILVGLQWLLNEAKQGEDVFFYFSGHGDVENVDGQNKGFLLANDAPKNNYMLGGTLPVSLLDSVFTTLVNRDVKVWLFIDACHSGNLAGGMSGVSKTTETLSKQWDQQIRLLSAQPDQLSVEDEKWGGGRGVFSYYLTKGMSGFANSNADDKITLSELENYLGNNINEQTSSLQQPHVEGANKFNFQVSIFDTTQMKAYHGDVVSGEISLAMNTKSGEWNLDGIAKQLAYELEEKLKNGLTNKTFLSIQKLWKQLDSLSNDIPIELGHLYMRKLINAINQVVNTTLKGEKLDTENQVNYGISLIDELLKINEGKLFLMKDHFMTVSSYLKTLEYTSSRSKFEYEKILSYEIYAINISWIPDEVELLDLLEEVGIYDVKDLKLKDTVIYYENINEQIEYSVKFKSTFESAVKFLLTFRKKYKVNSELRNLYYQNHISIYKPEEKINSKSLTLKIFELEKKKLDILTKEINQGLIKEPDAAYLYYAKGILLNHFDMKDSALLMLEKCINLAPKWLNPLYAKGLIYQSQKKYNESILTLENVLKLDSLYQDFECLDCFFMGLLNLYVKEHQIEKIDPCIKKWSLMREKMSSMFELYSQLISDPNSTVNEKEFWLKRLRNLDISTVEEQFSLILNEVLTYPKKYSPNDFIQFNREVLAILLKGNESARLLFESNDVNRSMQFKSKLWNDYFKNGKAYQYSDSFQVIKQLLFLTDLKRYSEKKANELIKKESFILATLTRNDNLDWYIDWLEIVLEQVKYNEIKSKVVIYNSPFTDNRSEVIYFQSEIDSLNKNNEIILNNNLLSEKDKLTIITENNKNILETKEYIDELKTTCASNYFAQLLGIKNELFQKYYSPFFSDKFFDLFMNALAEDSNSWPDIDELKKKFTLFEDIVKLNQISLLIKEISNNSYWKH